ncbi:protein-glutamine gamma-glutamyltransferase K-like [Neolamprologus brichardi]|uniref:protein-glutamine gamma-glutamyltransferase K-like n=1 Tax=Neolamprologus brichardi TaxID=32507 RepID=UPI0003EC2E9B|nr:protein-glutamine gamma-glutamyltransferase K-like [Neolamprologus brichardi]
MPAERRSARGRSAVGRFPSVTFGFGEDTEEEKEEPKENNVKKGNACKEWLRKVCPCCCPKHDDVIDTEVTLVDGLGKEDGGNGERPVPDDKEIDEVLLKVKSIDLLKSKSGANRTEHHTHLYQSDNLIIRRGQSFEMWITLSRPFNPSSDELHLDLKTGPLAVVAKGTHVIIPLVAKLEGDRWEAAVVKQEVKKIKLLVNSPTTAVIGRYQLTVETNNQNGSASSTHDPANDIYILFNPWCQGKYGHLMVNSPDDQGVLEGNWSGDYSNGTSPTVWSGSVEILEEYHKKNGTPVKYGQCWVFAGVVTTVLRCLGIPTRTVTNFSSAHDTDVSLTTDVYLDENLEPIEYLNVDSIWNFHVWNDCWMARKDLPPGNGGWQAVDATPQETSQGTYCCGPASLAAVRYGQVYLKHDTGFVFAEVNSDKIYWQKNADGTFTQIYSEKKIVGISISTKAVGSNERSDITHLYKHPEGSNEERIAVETACSFGSKAKAYSSPTAQDVSLEVTLDGDGPKMGKDAELMIKLKNSSSQQRSVSLHSQVSVMYYTGVHKATVRTDTTDIEVLPNEEKILEWALEYKDYKDKLMDQAALMLTVSGRVKETQQILATQFSFRLRTPDLIIKPLGKAVVGKKMSVEISFTNPLPQVLKAVIFHVEGLGLMTARKINYGDIGSHASVSLTEQFIPTLSGTRKLLASLDCKQVRQVHGVSDITVEEKSNAPL